VSQTQAILMVLNGTEISGSITFLMVGPYHRDSVEAEDQIRPDPIMEIPVAHDQVVIISVPLDAEVTIEAFPATTSAGGQNKINTALALATFGLHGHRDPSPDERPGAALTVSTKRLLGQRFGVLTRPRTATNSPPRNRCLTHSGKKPRSADRVPSRWFAGVASW
jgi:hypothetical protein